MKLRLPFLVLILSSCILLGSGTRIVSGTLTGNVPATVKVGLFAPGSATTFIHDSFNNLDLDIVKANDLGDEIGDAAGPFTPVVVAVPSGGSYTIEFPEDPSTVKCLIAWNDVDGDGLYDFDNTAETAYLPVKTIDEVNYAVHHFSSIEEASVVTYLAIYSNMDYSAVDFGIFYDDNFDAIGADGFNFNFR